MHPLIISDIIYHKIIEEIEDYAIILLDKNGLIQNWNKGAEKINGYKAEEIIGKNVRIFYPREERSGHSPDDLLAKAASKGKAHYEGWRVRKNGSLFWANVLLTALYEKDGHIIGFSQVTYDLSKQKETEAAIVKAIVDSQEKEKRSISVTLQDQVGQALTAAIALLQNAGKEGRNSFVLESEQYLQNALADIKDISLRINPDTVLSGNLPAAIRELVEKIKLQKKMRLRFTCVPKTLHAGHELQLALYRIVQEQMENILKHAEAGFVTIDLRNQKKRITLTITDNGKGFQPDKVEKGTGIRKIFYTAGLYHGYAYLNSAQGKGCMLKVIIPVKAGPG